ncbi:MAG: EamA family transporter [Brooklawnia sp.]|uniref:EamA family transporter n=1 Tax=Brooklawnia sp. TaxID=2699740 RepID=UPI003C777B71
MPNLPAPYPSSSSNRQVSHELAVLAALGSVVGVEIGAALGKGLFAQVPPTTAAWLRFTFAAVVLLSMRGVGAGLQRLRGRPVPPRPGLTRTAVLSALPYCLALAGMNWSFYLAIETIPLGIAVTIEYLGPLAVAIIGSRGRLDLLWAGLAGVGVALLGLRPVALDPRGVGFILVAATCWAGYITLGVRARRHWAGADLVTMACLFGSVTLAGPAVAFGGANLWTSGVLAMGLAVGVFSSVLPYTLDMVAFGRISPALFSILQSLAPAVAAVAGWLLLSEVLGVTDWLALLCVVTASAGATLSSAARVQAAGRTRQGRMSRRVRNQPSPEDRPGDPAAGQPDHR